MADKLIVKKKYQDEQIQTSKNIVVWKFLLYRTLSLNRLETSMKTNFRS